jgi:hypothetical protein
MMQFLKSEKYSIAFSFIIGVGIMAALKPGCRERDCSTKRAAPTEEVVKSTFQIGNKCYQFNTRNVECPTNGEITEAFRHS